MIDSSGYSRSDPLQGLLNQTHPYRGYGYTLVAYFPHVLNGGSGRGLEQATLYLLYNGTRFNSRFTQLRQFLISLVKADSCRALGPFQNPSLLNSRKYQTQTSYDKTLSPTNSKSKSKKPDPERN